MNKELAKKQKCLRTRSSIEIWLDEEKWVKLEAILSNSNLGKFINIEERMVNIADIEGIFLPKDLEELKRRKQGQWQCGYGNWHNRNESSCDCGNKIHAEEQMKEREESSKDLTPDQIKNNGIAIQKMREKFFKKNK